MRQHLTGTAVLGALGGLLHVVDERAVAVVQPRPAGSATVIHGSFLALRADNIVPPRRAIRLGCADRQPQPSSCNRSSSMPKWWAISWITVIRTSSTTSSSESHISSSASR